jgi:AcrR family transcriptional regulator
MLHDGYVSNHLLAYIFLVQSTMQVIACIISERRLAMPKQSDRESIPEAPRQRIIRAAMDLFAQYGYSRSSTRQIAKAAGVNEVTLFRHFGSKKNLLMACMQAFNTSGFSATFEAYLTGSYEEDIKRLADLLAEDTAANVQMLQLLLVEARLIPELKQALLEGGQGNLERLSAYFQRQIEIGIVRPELSPYVLASTFSSLFSVNLIFENMIEGSMTPQLSSQEVRRSQVELFIQGTRLE